MADEPSPRDRAGEFVLFRALPLTLCGVLAEQLRQRRPLEQLRTLAFTAGRALAASTLDPHDVVEQVMLIAAEDRRHRSYGVRAEQTTGTMCAALAAASTQRRRHDVLCALGPQAARFGAWLLQEHLEGSFFRWRSCPVYVPA